MHVVCASARVITPRGFTSFPTQEVEYNFSDSIPTNKQTNIPDLIGLPSGMVETEKFDMCGSRGLKHLEVLFWYFH